MNELSPKERLDRVLAGKAVDRPPVICPGGMMNSATVDVIEGLGLSFPKVHPDAEAIRPPDLFYYPLHNKRGWEHLHLSSL